MRRKFQQAPIITYTLICIFALVICLPSKYLIICLLSKYFWVLCSSQRTTASFVYQILPISSTQGCHSRFLPSLYIIMYSFPPHQEIYKKYIKNIFSTLIKSCNPSSSPSYYPVSFLSFLLESVFHICSLN